MGLIDSIKQLFSMGDTIKNAQQIQADAQAKYTAGTGPIDESLPQWQPIHGVKLDTYAEISALLQKNVVMGIEAVNAFAEERGVPAGKWSEVQMGWTQRMGQHQDVANRFGTIQSQFLS